MTMRESNRPRIAIIGAGVCGITCALALAKNGVNAHIYEAKVKCITSRAQTSSTEITRANTGKSVPVLVSVCVLKWRAGTCSFIINS